MRYLGLPSCGVLGVVYISIPIDMVSLPVEYVYVMSGYINNYASDMSRRVCVEFRLGTIC
jgi:hypothetical protein